MPVLPMAKLQAHRRSRERYQHPLPGLFDTALEAAQYLAMVKRDFGPDGVEPPPKQNKPLKSRKRQCVEPETQPAATPPPVVPLQMSPAVTMATVIPFPMMHAPLVAATLLPVPPPCYTPPIMPLL